MVLSIKRQLTLSPMTTRQNYKKLKTEINLKNVSIRYYIQRLVFITYKDLHSTRKPNTKMSKGSEYISPKINKYLINTQIHKVIF